MSLSNAKTKAEFFALAEMTGVEIEDDGKPGGALDLRHVHAYAPTGFKFEATGTHNIGLGDYARGERPNWRELAEEIRLVECDEGDDCEYCHGEE